MDGIDTGNLIGALELGDHLTSFDDGALEAVGAYAALGPTQGCPTSGLACLTNVCRPHVDDGALLQAAGVTMANPTPTSGFACFPTYACRGGL
jgi:hypothetical protein